MTYERRWGIVVATALGLLVGCAPTDYTYATGSGSSGSGGTDAACGDGVRGSDEACDGSDLGGATCASVLGAGYFALPGKALACKPDCSLDATACSNACVPDAPGSLLDSCALQ